MKPLLLGKTNFFGDRKVDFGFPTLGIDFRLKRTKRLTFYLDFRRWDIQKLGFRVSEI